MAPENSIVTLRHSSGAVARISLHGATVCSWKTPDGVERLFCSELTSLKGPSAIRGGIPICWPVFGPPPQDKPIFERLKQHGLARISKWTYEAEENPPKDSVCAHFTLSSNSETEKLFAPAFALRYSVILEPFQLTTRLRVENPAGSSTELSFQALLHNYFQLASSVDFATLSSLDKIEYVDKVDGAKTKTQDGADVRWVDETDRVYKSAPAELTLSEDKRPVVSITKENLDDIVVWNPGFVKGCGMADLKSEDWNRFVCVEPGQTQTFIKLEAGEEWTGSQTISAL